MSNEDVIGWIWTGETRVPQPGERYLSIADAAILHRRDGDGLCDARRICRKLTQADAVVSAGALNVLRAAHETTPVIDVGAIRNPYWQHLLVAAFDVLDSRLPAPQPDHIATARQIVERGPESVKKEDIVRAVAWLLDREVKTQ